MSLMAATAASGMNVTTAKTDREKLSATAKQFESIFVKQMMSEARKTNLAGEDSIFSSEGMGTFRQMQDEQFADLTAQTGTLGLAKIIEQQMARFLPKEDQTAAAGNTQSASTAQVTSEGKQ